jgi:hypothetical protein
LTVLLLAGFASARESSAAVAPPADRNAAIAESRPLDPSEFLRREALEARRAAQARKAEPCRTPINPMLAIIDDLHAQLFRTLCGASRWFDGLFGEQQHPAAARNTSGRLELSATYSERDGAKFRTRFNVRLRIPNMEDRVEAFLGRDNDDEFVQGRNEGLALRSQFLNLEREDRWVLGLGYGLPGSYKQKTDVRVGVRGGLRAPETFAQARYLRNWFLGDDNLWHFREIGFWTNHDGFGATTSVDFDHIIGPTRIFRWSNVATNSQATHAWNWRSALVLYQNLPSRQAIAYETFVRGETAAEVPLQEYGARTVYRRGITSRPWLYGEFVAGYSWPQYRREEKRRGSAAVGFGIEILIGQD